MALRRVAEQEAAATPGAREGWNLCGSAPKVGALTGAADVATPVTDRRPRAKMWEATRWLHKRSRLDSVRLCRRYAIDEAQGVALNVGAGASFGGLKTCGSPWSCPLCAERVWLHRADRLESALRAWHEAGGSVGLVTLTMRHKRRHGLTPLWDARSKAWTAVRGSRAVRAWAEDARVAGYCVRTEVTDGPNGWHVHLHVLVFLRGRGAAAARLDGWAGKAFSSWRGGLAAYRSHPRTFIGPLPAGAIMPGDLEPDDAHGCDVKLLDLTDAAGAVGDYVAKGAPPASVFGVAREVTDAGTKQGRRAGRMTQWQLLREAAEGDAGAAARWSEWEHGSKGRRALVWTRALKKELGVDDLGDDAEVPEEEPSRPLLWMHPQAWRDVVLAKGRADELLRAVEAALASAPPGHDGRDLASADASFLLSRWGVPDRWVLWPPG